MTEYKFRKCEYEGPDGKLVDLGKGTLKYGGFPARDLPEFIEIPAECRDIREWRCTGDLILRLSEIARVSMGCEYDREKRVLVVVQDRRASGRVSSMYTYRKEYLKELHTVHRTYFQYRLAQERHEGAERYWRRRIHRLCLAGKA